MRTRRSEKEGNSEAGQLIKNGNANAHEQNSE